MLGIVRLRPPVHVAKACAQESAGMPAKVQRTASRSSSLLVPSKLLAAATQHAGVVNRHDASDSSMPKLSPHCLPTRACHCSGCRSGRELVGNKTCTPVSSQQPSRCVRSCACHAGPAEHHMSVSRLVELAHIAAAGTPAGVHQPLMAQQLSQACAAQAGGASTSTCQ